VNLTLTETEERFLDAITAGGTAEHDALVRLLESESGRSTAAADQPLGLADVVHVLIGIGFDRLEFDLAEISYAAQAAGSTPEDDARAAALERSFAESLRRDIG
jgi:hypothetical protein